MDSFLSKFTVVHVRSPFVFAVFKTRHFKRNYCGFRSHVSKTLSQGFVLWA